MARSRTLSRSSGFSLVELMVALVFTLIMMAGMAAVFKASLSTLFTSGEAASSGRRNRMSLDQLGNDINTAAMYLTNLTAPPVTDASYPPIYIMPNMPMVQVDGTTNLPGNASSLDPTTSDQLVFYVDEALPFEGNLVTGPTSADSANTLVANGTAPAITDFTYFIDCHTAPYANLVVAGQNFIFKDNFEVGSIQSVSLYNSTTVKVVEADADTAGYTGMSGITGQSNGSGLPSKFTHVTGAGVVFVLPAQIVLYQVKMLQLDMNRPNGIPCLVRDQYNYSDVVNAKSFTGPVATVPEQILTENVQAFKVYMSCNSGQTWAGLGLPSTTTGWTGWSTASTGIRALLDTQLAAAGRAGFTTTEGNEQWFRSIPTLVRCDITTRTAAQRTEYYTENDPNNPGNVANPYKNYLQTLVFMPRHSGLPMD
jgi:hypothetical protein